MTEKLDAKNIVAEISVELIKDTAKGAFKQITTYFKDSQIKMDIDFGNAFEEYLEYSAKSYGKVKTLIYRHEAKNLYAFYENLGLKHGKGIINTENIHNVLKIGNKLIITGTGGIGKTTMLKHFFINTIEESNMIPVLVELRKLNDKDINDIMIIDTIYEGLINFGFNVEKEYFKYSMETGCYLILFDGYDEINQGYNQKITKEITDLCNKYPQNNYILSSRPTEEFLGWNDFIEMSACPLSKKQALSLISKLEYDEDIKSVFYKELEKKLYDKYESFASNPLLLTIMLLTFESRAAIPDKLNDFYEQAFATLYNIHDGTKGPYKRDIRSRLGYEDFKLVFSYVCFKSYFKNEYEFTEKSIRGYIKDAKIKFKDMDINFEVEDFKEDLVNSVCMLIREGLNYRFSHRSFQEYFAAWYTCKLTDDIQEKLIDSLIKHTLFYNMDNYLPMLYNLQSEKFNKVILSPGLKEIQIIYNQVGYIGLLSEIYEGVKLTDMHEDEEMRVVLCIKNNYLQAIISITCDFHSYNYSDSEQDEELTKTLMNAFPMNELVRFDIIKEMGMVEEFLEYFKTIKDRIDFSINVLKRIKENNISDTSTLNSIIDQL